MRAVRLSGTGDPSVLRIDDVAAPRPPTGDRILVRVAASSINGTDLGLRRGVPGAAVFGRLVGLGFDIAGEVVAVGPAVTAFAPGDRVAALLPHNGGGQAEEVVLRQGRVALVPGGVDIVEAAGLPLAGLTALQALFGRAGLGTRPSARVLVYGAAGGIGSFAVQLAALAGAHVTGTASAAKRDYVRGLGADDVVDHEGALDGRERWDVVLDTPGLLDPVQVRPALAPDGVLVTTRVGGRRDGTGAGARRRAPRATVRLRGHIRPVPGPDPPAGPGPQRTAARAGGSGRPARPDRRRAPLRREPGGAGQGRGDDLVLISASVAPSSALRSHSAVSRADEQRFGSEVRPGTALT
jgi:NADPH:quinone reductase-like Zn-dependent oxidoreductase